MNIKVNIALFIYETVFNFVEKIQQQTSKLFVPWCNENEKKIPLIPFNRILFLFSSSFFHTRSSNYLHSRRYEETLLFVCSFFDLMEFHGIHLKQNGLLIQRRWFGCWKIEHHPHLHTNKFIAPKILIHNWNNSMDSRSLTSLSHSHIEWLFFFFFQSMKTIVR